MLFQFSFIISVELINFVGRRSIGFIREKQATPISEKQTQFFGECEKCLRIFHKWKVACVLFANSTALGTTTFCLQAVLTSGRGLTEHFRVYLLFFLGLRFLFSLLFQLQLTVLRKEQCLFLMLAAHRSKSFIFFRRLSVWCSVVKAFLELSYQVLWSCHKQTLMLSCRKMSFI